MLTACFFMRPRSTLEGFHHYMPTYCELSMHNAWNSYQQHTHVKFSHAHTVRTKSTPCKIIMQRYNRVEHTAETRPLMSSASLCSCSAATVKDSGTSGASGAEYEYIKGHLKSCFKQQLIPDEVFYNQSSDFFHYFNILKLPLLVSPDCSIMCTDQHPELGLQWAPAQVLR